MAHDVLHDCPVCHKALHVTRLHCPSCGTTIEGDFQAERLLALTPEQRSFVYSFLRNRGNIREMEKELGISYPTVRARLDQVIAALGIERVALGLGLLDAQALELGLLRGVCLGTLAGGLLGTQAPELLALLVGQGCLVCHGCSSCLPHGAWFGWLGSRPLV